MYICRPNYLTCLSHLQITCYKAAMRVLICALSKHSMKWEITFTLPYSITMHDLVWYWYFVTGMSGCNIKSSWVISQNDVPQNHDFKDNLSGLTWWVINYVICNINWSIHNTSKHTCIWVHIHECRPPSTQSFPLSFIHAHIRTSIHTNIHTYKHKRTYLYTYIHMNIHKYLYTYIPIYILHACLQTYIHIYIHTYILTHTHTHIIYYTGHCLLKYCWYALFLNAGSPSIIR